VLESPSKESKVYLTGYHIDENPIK